MSDIQISMSREAWHIVLSALSDEYNRHVKRIMPGDSNLVRMALLAQADAIDDARMVVSDALREAEDARRDAIAESEKLLADTLADFFADAKVVKRLDDKDGYMRVLLDTPEDQFEYKELSIHLESGDWELV